MQTMAGRRMQMQTLAGRRIDRSSWARKTQFVGWKPNPAFICFPLSDADTAVLSVILADSEIEDDIKEDVSHNDEKSSQFHAPRKI